MPKKKYMVSGGGTGGHIFPALSIANELKAQDPQCEIEFVGAEGRMEMERVPKEGYVIHGLPIIGLNRQNMAANLKFPVKLIRSVAYCRKLLKKFQPDVVIGTGGFASGPLLYVAQRMGIPTVIQEQNSYAGITNKRLGAKAKAICVAYEHMDNFFPSDRIHLTGNPVRPEIVEQKKVTDKDYKGFNLDPNKPTLLVLGGSLGARRINEAVSDLLDWTEKAGIQILWQCGKLYYEKLKPVVHNRDNVQLNAFISNMNAAYGVADVILSRAGAGTISELAIIGKPTILIPSPNVAEDHQTKNAMALVEKKAALLIRESEIDSRLEADLARLFQDDSRKSELSSNLNAMAIPDATKRIVELIHRAQS